MNFCNANSFFLALKNKILHLESEIDISKWHVAVLTCVVSQERFSSCLQIVHRL